MLAGQRCFQETNLLRAQCKNFLSKFDSPPGQQVTRKPDDIKRSASIPFDFVLETLAPRSPLVRPMFGCYAIYVDGKLVLILRQRKDHPHDNGVWLATVEEAHADLKKIFPCMRSVRLLGGKKTVWQNLPVSEEAFEELVLTACEMILRNDPRIGKIPGAKKRKTVRKR